MTNSNELPRSVKHVTLDDRDIYLVGTAHVSKESVEDVYQTVEKVCPDTICVELCDARHKAMRDRDNWKKMDIFRIVKEKKALLLLSQLVMTSFYKQIGQQLGVEPGAEMKAGIELAEKNNTSLSLADRDIQITLKRVWGNLTFRDKAKMLFQLSAGLFIGEKIDEKTINEMKEQDKIEGVLETFSKEFPSVKEILIDERDIYLAQKIRETEGKKVVAVVGAGHVPGITKHIQNNNSLDPLVEIPKGSIITKCVKWLIPLAIIGVFIYGFLFADLTKSMQAVYIWVLVNGILSALGALIAYGHPLTVLSAFVAAPLTSLNPLIAAGWVSGLVQAWIKRPTVEDLENLPNAITTMKGFWQNSVSRILLVVVFSNIGSSIGSLVAVPWILKNFMS